MTGAQADDVPPWTGPWADDARTVLRLVRAAVEGLDPVGPPGPEVGHAPECRWCPVCRGVVMLRRAGPDVLDEIAELAAGLAATLRTEATSPSSPAPTSPAPTSADRTSADRTPADPSSEDPSSEDPSGRPGGPRRRPAGTVRIDVTD